MPSAQFDRMRDIISAPSPVGFERAMTGAIARTLRELDGTQAWEFREFAGNAGLVVDTAPGRDDLLKIMVCGHADKIRMQVRHVSADGEFKGATLGQEQCPANFDSTGATDTRTACPGGGSLTPPMTPNLANPCP
jgi:putative aminopeptidase FrvX